MLVLAVLGLLVWLWASDQAGVRRAAPKVSTIIPLPPPPPPPEKPPEPEKVEDQVAETEPRPMEQIKPKIEAPPRLADSAMTMDTAGQAGADAFNIGAGAGGGMGGGGGGTATYGQYLAYALQQALQSDERTRRLVFKLVVDIWLDPSGRLTRINLIESSGSPKADAAVLAALRAVDRVDEKPTAGLTFPARVVITGRRQS